MKETVTIYRFLDVFKGSNTYQNHFSHDGLIALFEYLEDYEDDTGEEIEFDMVAICCDYTEYDSLKDFNADYAGTPGNNCWKYETLNDIREETVVISIPDTKRFIIQEF